MQRLADGTAFVDVSDMRAIGVSGADARSWLNDLVSADLENLVAGSAVPSLLLAPTGGVRAGFTATTWGGGVLLLQDPVQPVSIGNLLAPYVLSSEVRLDDRTGELAILAFPGLRRAPDVEGTESWTPSVLGVGADLAAPRADLERITGALAERFVAASTEDAEAWRVSAGMTRVGVDTADGDLPQEAGLETAVAFDKGCFVGQEAVAKTRNMGHPRRLLLAVTSDRVVAEGDPVLAGDDVTGRLTSTATDGERVYALARVRWKDRERPLRTATGVALRPRSGVEPRPR